MKTPKPQHGGKRPGAGRKPIPKTTPNTATDKAIDRERARALISAHLLELIKRHIQTAMGIRHFFLRDPDTGQWKRIQDPDEIEKALNGKAEHYWIYTKDPDERAFTDLMNRCLDKPAEQVEVTGADKGPIAFRWIE